MTHSELVNDIINDCNKINGVMLWKNPIGFAFVGKVTRIGKGSNVLIENPRKITYGLQKGSSDIIGFCRLGKEAIFVAIECKVGKDTLKQGQKDFLKMAKLNGCICGVARSVCGAVTLLTNVDSFNQ